MRIIEWARGERLLWVRLCGYGFCIKDDRVHPPLFSQRHGCLRGRNFGWLWIELLTPRGTK